MPDTADPSLWEWVARQGQDEVRVRTFVHLADVEAVLDGFAMAPGTREQLTSRDAEERRFSRESSEHPEFQMRICPLGDWTLVLEDGSAVHLEPWKAWNVRPSFPEGVATLRVEWTLTTGIGVEHRSGDPAVPASWFGDVVGPPSGHFGEIAARLGLVHGDPHDDDHARLLTAVAEDLGIPSVPVSVVLGELLTVTRRGPLV